MSEGNAVQRQTGGADGVGVGLPQLELVKAGQAHGHALPPEHHPAGDALFAREVAAGHARLADEPGDVPGVDARPGQNLDAAAGQIGRASCRERV